MPKSKKKKREDFQKVKLKVGKGKLSKGDNVTNLSFKTRQIQLTQTIRDGEGQEPVTRRKLNIQDLLRQCEHHGVSARVNAVAGLKELWLSGHQEFMQLNNKHTYGTILQKLATMFIDNEAVVRHTVIGLFKVIVNRVSANCKNIPKGFPLLHIHTYLGCALSNMHEDIKLDALLVFDVLLDCVPSMLIDQTGDLLNHLLGFISAPVGFGSRGGSTTQKLSLNPESKLPVMQFRAKVLSRIKRLFQIASNSKRSVPGSPVKEKPVWGIGGDLAQGRSSSQDTYILSSQNKTKFKMLFSGACHEIESYLTKPKTLEYFLANSITVLLQCWREAFASVDSSTPSHGGIVSRDSAEVMSFVVSIIQLSFHLCGLRRTKCDNEDSNTLVSGDVLAASRASEFEKLFLPGFPYSVQVQVPSGKRKKKLHQEVNHSFSETLVDELNIGLCDITCSFFKSETYTLEPSYCRGIQEYIKSCLQKKPNGEDCATIARCLKNISKSSAALRKFLPTFKAALEFYQSCPVISGSKKTMFEVFASLCHRWNGEKGAEGVLSTSWLIMKFYATLPKLLLNVMRKKGDSSWAVDILDLMIKAKSQHCDKFSERFILNLPQYLAPDSSILLSESEEIVAKLFFLVSQGTALTVDHYKLIVEAVRQPPCGRQVTAVSPPSVEDTAVTPPLCSNSLIEMRKSCSMVGIVLHSLSLNICQLVPVMSQAEFTHRTEVQETLLSDFLSFMVSLFIGMSKSVLDDYSPRLEDVKVCEMSSNVTTQQWQRHVNIAQVVSKELLNFHLPACADAGYMESFSLADSVELLICKTLVNRRKIHIVTVYSLCTYLKYFYGKNKSSRPRQDFLQLAAQVLSACLIQINSRDEDVPEKKQMIWTMKTLILHVLQDEKQLLQAIWILLSQNDAKTSASRETAQEFLMSHSTIKQHISDFKIK